MPHRLHARVAQGQKRCGFVRQMLKSDREEADQNRAQRQAQAGLPQSRQGQGDVRKAAARRTSLATTANAAARHQQLAACRHAQQQPERAQQRKLGAQKQLNSE